MAERKVKPEIMHLMILDNCDHKCNLCCNKMYDIDKIPVATVEEMKTVHTVCITGGEPFMSNINIDRFALNLKKQFPNVENVYVYTSGSAFVFNINNFGYNFLDGINFAPKTKGDWEQLKYASAHLREDIRESIRTRKSNRLYVFKEHVDLFENNYKYIAKKLNLNVLYRTWDKEFKTPDNDIFRRLPIFLN